MSLAYHLFVKLLEPTSLCVILLLAAAVLRRRATASRICFWLAVAVLLVCGNGWVSGALIRHLERRYVAPEPIPQVDCILVLGGGTLSRLPPRPTVEVDEAGDRVLYGAYLYRQHKARSIICTGGGSGPRAGAEDMAELLESLGVPRDAIIKETKAMNTHEHATRLFPLLKERGFKRILLVTSAMHIPRAMGVFRRDCPGLQFIPAPTDFRVVDSDAPWYAQVFAPIPTPHQLVNFSDAMHEYLGMAYYKLRGWE
jgi:uncharacterized SAM-binding protein YcdF (DUF218 family)